MAAEIKNTLALEGLEAARQAHTKPEARAPAMPGRPRAARAVMRMFQAADADRLTASWSSMPMAADDIVRKNQRTLVARSREQAANNDYAKDFLRLCRVNIVGPKGIQLQARSRDPSGSLDKLANQSIEAAWNAWGHRDNCDVTGVQSLRQLQAAAVNSAAMDGEFFIRMVFGADAGPWGFGLQLLDAQRCPVDYDVSGAPGGGFVRHGIEFTRWGRPVAYYFSDVDARADANSYSYGGRSFVRVPADEIVHGFLPQFPGQKRGLPWLSTALWRLRMLGRWEDAALVNALVGAAKMGFFENEEGDESDEEIEIDADPGTFHELPGGVKLKEWNPQYPSGEFETFHRAALRGISAGLGVSYHNLSRDLTSVNFSSIRQGTLDERDTWMELQEWVTEAFLQPVFEAWLPRALLGKRITVAGKPLRPDRKDKYSEIEWQARRWQWIDPLKDVNAAVESMARGLRSPSDIIRESGRDPASVWAQYAADMQAMRDAGLPDDMIARILIAKGTSHASAPDTQS